MITCGNCRGKHGTVAEVRECHGHKDASAESATERQRAFLDALLTERGMAPIPATFDISKAAASARISELVNTPKSVAPVHVVRKAENFSDIPAGYYATPSRTGNNDLDFWRVDRPTEGRWRGFLFVKRVVGGRPEQSVRRSEKDEALKAIRAAGPEQAATKYGQAIGRCYRCNRHLTDETSRFLGIGPDCRSKVA